MTQKRFDGKIALVTGGNSGIGFATASRLVAEGATLVITGRDRQTSGLARSRFSLIQAGRWRDH